MKRVDIGSQQVRDVMTFHAVAASPSDSVKDALDLMVANRVLALPVVDDANRCVGIISASDLLELAQERGEDIESFSVAEGLAYELLVEHFEHADFSDLTVQDAMTPTPIEIAPEDTLVEAARVMVENEIHHLAVTERRRQFLGILSSMDVLRALAESTA